MKNSNESNVKVVVENVVTAKLSIGGTGVYHLGERGIYPGRLYAIHPSRIWSEIIGGDIEIIEVSDSMEDTEYLGDIEEFLSSNYTEKEVNELSGIWVMYKYIDGADAESNTHSFPIEEFVAHITER